MSLHFSFIYLDFNAFFSFPGLFDFGQYGLFTLPLLLSHLYLSLGFRTWIFDFGDLFWITSYRVHDLWLESFLCRRSNGILSDLASHIVFVSWRNVSRYHVFCGFLRSIDCRKRRFLLNNNFWRFNLKLRLLLSLEWFLFYLNFIKKSIYFWLHWNFNVLFLFLFLFADNCLFSNNLRYTFLRIVDYPLQSKYLPQIFLL